MTDLRDQLADLITDREIGTERARHIADRIVDAGWTPPRTVDLTRNRATCHTDRPVEARGLCKSCYTRATAIGTLTEHPVKHRPYRRITEVVDMWQLLKAEGATTQTIATELGMTRDALSQAIRRAAKRGLLIPREDTP